MRSKNEQKDLTKTSIWRIFVYWDSVMDLQEERNGKRRIRIGENESISSKRNKKVR